MRLHHVSIPVAPGQLNNGRTFYTDIVGLTELPAPETLGQERVAWFSLGECELHLFIEAAAIAAESGRHFALAVESLTSIQQRLESHGVTIEEAEPIHNRPRFFFHDPFGNRVEVTQILGEYQ